MCVIAALVVINNAEFKAFWIPTAMTTMSHKYLAYTLYDVDTVNKIMSENYIEQNTEKVNLDDIKLVKFQVEGFENGKLKFTK